MKGVSSLGERISPINRRRLDNFRANRRGYWSLWIFLFLFLISLFAEFLANDKPIFIQYDGHFFFPILVSYPETIFGVILKQRPSTQTLKYKI